MVTACSTAGHHGGGVNPPGEHWEEIQAEGRIGSVLRPRRLPRRGKMAGEEGNGLTWTGEDKCDEGHGSGDRGAGHARRAPSQTRKGDRGDTGCCDVGAMEMGGAEVRRGRLGNAAAGGRRPPGDREDEVMAWGAEAVA